MAPGRSEVSSTRALAVGILRLLSVLAAKKPREPVERAPAPVLAPHAWAHEEQDQHREADDEDPVGRFHTRERTLDPMRVLRPRARTARAVFEIRRAVSPHRTKGLQAGFRVTRSPARPGRGLRAWDSSADLKR